MVVTAWPFIQLDSTGVAWVQGTRIKVIELAMDHLAHRWDAIEIHREHPAISLFCIHAALGYYYEHQSEFDELIARDVRRADELCTSLGNPDIVAKMRTVPQP